MENVHQVKPAIHFETRGRLNMQRATLIDYRFLKFNNILKSKEYNPKLDYIPDN